MDAAGATHIHRCPGCGGAHAERRTARNLRERATLTVLGYHPYRCLDCGRRFLDRPLTRPAPEPGDGRRADVDQPADVGEPAPLEVVVVEPAPSLVEHAATLAITTGDTDEPRRRRRARWVLDAGNIPLGRAEIYALVLAGGLLVLVFMALLRLSWPESVGGVKLGE
jgi:hypothetical protein